jgi:hypothetical protein
MRHPAIYMMPQITAIIAPDDIASSRTQEEDSFTT